MTDVWGFLLQTLTVSGAAAVLLLVKALLKDRLPHSWHAAVWVLLGVVMLLPAGWGGRYLFIPWQTAVEAVKLWAGDYSVTWVRYPVPVLTEMPQTPAQWGFAVYVAGAVINLLFRWGKLFWRGTDQQEYRLDGREESSGTRGIQAVIGLFESLHWCNPLIRFCASRARKDAEAWYAEVVHARRSGKNAALRGRGTRALSVCTFLVLAVFLIIGTPTKPLDREKAPFWLKAAAAKSTSCTTPAGACDAFAKAVLTGSGYWRLLCAPASEQEAILEDLRQKEEAGQQASWETGLPGRAEAMSGYAILEWNETEKDVFEGWLAVRLRPEGDNPGAGNMWAAFCPLRVEKENGRYVATAQGPFEKRATASMQLSWGAASLPGTVYEGELAGVRVRVKHQTVHTVENLIVRSTDGVAFGDTYTEFDTVPRPHTRFTLAAVMESQSLTYPGDAAARDAITTVGLITVPVAAGEEDPTAITPSSTGIGSPAAVSTEPGWGPELSLNTWSQTVDPYREPSRPDRYAAALYLNGERTAEGTLVRVKGVGE